MAGREELLLFAEALVRQFRVVAGKGEVAKRMNERGVILFPVFAEVVLPPIGQLLGHDVFDGRSVHVGALLVAVADFDSFEQELGLLAAPAAVEFRAAESVEKLLIATATSLGEDCLNRREESSFLFCLPVERCEELPEGVCRHSAHEATNKV